MRSLLTKTLYDKRWFILGWSAAFAFTAFLLVIFFPSFSGGTQIEEIAKSLPPQLQGLLGDAEAWKTIRGYLATELFDIRIPLFLMVMAIVLGNSLSITEEESGRLRTVLSAPASRTKVLLQKWFAIVIINGVISFSLAVAVYLSIFLIRETPPNVLIWQLSALSWLYGTTITTLVFAIGLGSGKRALTMSVSILVVVGSFILTTFGKAVDWLKPYENASLLHYYNATSLYNNTFKSLNIAVLLSVMIVLLIIGIFAFRRRDVS